MIFQTELTSLESELSQLEMMLIAKRQELGFFQNLQTQADECLEKLSRVVNHAKENTAHGAIASLKSAVLTLFGSGDNGNDGGNQPSNPTPDTDPTPGGVDDEPELLCLNGITGDCLTTDDLDDSPASTTKLTYAQVIKNRCSACWGYEVTSKADIKAGFINRTNINFMEAVNLERSGREFYETVEGYLNKLYYNGQSCEWASLFASPVSFDDTLYPSLLTAGSRFWHGATWSTGTVIEPLGDDEYRCQIDGAVGEVELERHHLHYIPSLLEGQHCDIDKAPLFGQHCTITQSATEDNENKGSEGEAMPFVELIKVTDAVAYQRKHDGEILCCYIGFRTKAHAQSWLHFLEALTSKADLRQAKRLEGFKWEIKVHGASMSQIERFSQECDFSKSYRTEVCSSKPPSYKKPSHPQPVNPDEVEAGDIVTPLLTPGDSYEVIQVMPDGVLDCKSLRTGVNMGMRPSAVTLVQKASKYPPCPFASGDIVDWSGCKLRVAAVGVETLHCVLQSDPDGTRPHTKVPIAECVLVEEGLDVGDKVEINSDRYLGVKGEEVVVNAVLTTAELPIGVELPNGNTRYFPRNELKFIAKAPSQQQQFPTGLEGGTVLMGNRIVTAGNYTGLGRRNAINNARIGLQDKLAVIELVKAGVSREEAIAAVTLSTTASDDYDF